MKLWNKNLKLVVNWCCQYTSCSLNASQTLRFIIFAKKKRSARLLCIKTIFSVKKSKYFFTWNKLLSLKLYLLPERKNQFENEKVLKNKYKMVFFFVFLSINWTKLYQRSSVLFQNQNKYKNTLCVITSINL